MKTTLCKALAAPVAVALAGCSTVHPSASNHYTFQPAGLFCLLSACDVQYAPRAERAGGNVADGGGAATATQSAGNAVEFPKVPK